MPDSTIQPRLHSPAHTAPGICAFEPCTMRQPPGRRTHRGPFACKAAVPGRRCRLPRHPSARRRGGRRISYRRRHGGRRRTRPLTSPGAGGTARMATSRSAHRAARRQRRRHRKRLPQESIFFDQACVRLRHEVDRATLSAATSSAWASVALGEILRIQAASASRCRSAAAASCCGGRAGRAGGRRR